MDLGSPDLWRWIWLVMAVAFLAGEMSLAGTFFLAPFAAGAGVAAVTSFLGAPVEISWAVFLAVSAASFAGFRPLARRLDASAPRLPIGANRWVGREAIVIRDVPAGPGGSGLIRLDREEWRAESFSGEPISAGSRVLVSRVDGTRLVVMPLDGGGHILPTPEPKEP